MYGSVDETDGRLIIRTGVESDRTWIRSMGDVRLSPDPDLALIALLLPAMRAGHPLRIEGSVSGRLLEATDRIQDVICTWDRFLRPVHRWYRRVPIEAEVRTEAPQRAERTLCLFSGGVDSFHTVVTNRDRIDALLFVHGFDIRLDDEPLRRRVGEHLRRAADEIGLPLIEVESDLQPFGDRRGVGWPHYHGAALAAVATALAGEHGRLLVPGSQTYAYLEELGSHPLLDPLWSGDLLEVEHVGAEASRVDKIRAITDDPASRTHLRVCWENRDGAYNCGRCEKCVRTGVAVRLAGAEGRFPTVPPPSLRQIAGARATRRASYWRDLRSEVDLQNPPARLRWAIDLLIARHDIRSGRKRRADRRRLRRWHAEQRRGRG